MVSGSHLFRYLEKLDKKTQSDHVEIKGISNPPPFHFYFAHLGGITHLQYFSVVSENLLTCWDMVWSSHIHRGSMKKLMSEKSEEFCGWMPTEGLALPSAASSAKEAGNSYIEIVILQSEPVFWPGLGLNYGEDLFHDVALLNGRVILILLDSLSALR